MHLSDRLRLKLYFSFSGVRNLEGTDHQATHKTFRKSRLILGIQKMEKVLKIT